MQADSIAGAAGRADTTVVELTGYGVYGYAQGVAALAIIACIVALIVWRRRRRR